MRSHQVGLAGDFLRLGFLPPHTELAPVEEALRAVFEASRAKAEAKAQGEGGDNGDSDASSRMDFRGAVAELSEVIRALSDHNVHVLFLLSTLLSDMSLLVDFFVFLFMPRRLREILFACTLTVFLGLSVCALKCGHTRARCCFGFGFECPRTSRW